MKKEFGFLVAIFLVAVLNNCQCQENLIDDRSLQVLGPLIDFYGGFGSDYNARPLEQIWHLDDASLENDFSAFAWLFPLAFRSAHKQNPTPPLKGQDLLIFRKNPAILKNYLRSLKRVSRFFGVNLHFENELPIFSPAANYSARTKLWQTQPIEQKKRVTRVVKSLNLLGLDDVALAFLNELIDDEKNLAIDHKTAAVLRLLTPQFSKNNSK